MDNENVNVDSDETDVDETEVSETAAAKKRGQTKKTEAELRAAFETSGVQGLLEVDDKGRCTVRCIDGKKIETKYGPVAGNSFLRALDGAVRMGSLIERA